MTMRRPLRFLLVFAVAAIVMGHAPGAWACSCVGGLSQQDYLDNAAAAFVGVPFTKDAVEQPPDQPRPGGGGPFTYDFDVEDRLKGKVGPRIEVTTSDDGAMCGIRFTLGNRYRVYLYENEDGSYGTGLCSGNEDLGPSGRQIDPGRPPPPRATPTVTTEGATPQPSGTAAAGGPTPKRTIDAVSAGAPVEGGGSSGLVAGLGLVTLGTTVGAIVFSRRKRA